MKKLLLGLTLSLRNFGGLVRTMIDDQWVQAKGHINTVYVRGINDDLCLENVEQVQRSELTLDTWCLGWMTDRLSGRGFHQ